MQILLSERRICNFCKSDNSRLAQVWVCLCVQIGKKYITSLCKANMSHQWRPFFLHFIYSWLFCRWATIFPAKHAIIQCNATSLLKSDYQRNNIIFLGAKGGLYLLPASQLAATFYCFRLQSRQWLWRLCRCPHLPRVRRLTDQFTAPDVLCAEVCK